MDRHFVGQNQFSHMQGTVPSLQIIYLSQIGSESRLWRAPTAKSRSRSAQCPFRRLQAGRTGQTASSRNTQGTRNTSDFDGKEHTLDAIDALCSPSRAIQRACLPFFRTSRRSPPRRTRWGAAKPQSVLRQRSERYGVCT